jgi:hypothetical protein
MNTDLEHLRSTAKRLERYARRVREKIWLGNRDDLLSALADVAETGEIARRFYSLLERYVSTAAPPDAPRALKDDPTGAR